MTRDAIALIIRINQTGLLSAHTAKSSPGALLYVSSVSPKKKKPPPMPSMGCNVYIPARHGTSTGVKPLETWTGVYSHVENLAPK
jgi:hypothetical protein